MKNMLVITALGTDRPGLVNELSKTIAESGCSLTDSRMTLLGNEFAAILTASGKWNELAKLENCLPASGRRLKLSIHSKRTEVPQNRGDFLPYAIEVVALNSPELIHELSGFLAARAINIRELVTSSYAAGHTGTAMLSINMTVDIPGRILIALLRDEFMDFCDQLNLDALMEPIKG